MAKTDGGTATRAHPRPPRDLVAGTVPVATVDTLDHLRAALSGPDFPVHRVTVVGTDLAFVDAVRTRRPRRWFAGVRWFAGRRRVERVLVAARYELRTGAGFADRVRDLLRAAAPDGVELVDQPAPADPGTADELLRR
jgi:hypothetical protein